MALQQTVARKGVAPEAALKRVLVRLPDELCEELRVIAFQRRTTQQAILRDAVSRWLHRERNGNK